MLLQTLVTGLAIGGIYALMAVGYSLVFSILNFSNFAYGAIIMLGSYIGYFSLVKFGVPFPVALVLTMAGASLLSFFNERIAYSSLRKRRAPSLYFMISAMGTSIFLENMVYATIGSSFMAYPEIFKQQSIRILGSSIGLLDLFAIIFSFVSIYVLHYFINNSRTGIAIRAASYDSMITQINGVNLSRLIGLVFVLAGALAGISGIFLGMKYMAYPTMGWITNKAYIAAVIGGLGSLPGAVVGGIILGILESLVSVYIASTFRDVFSFSLLIILLLFMPAGLFGKYLEEKV
ncbi:MAG: branched-chain amino acid ABC transporter permease [Bacillota bacterium]|uniref:Branched-chain amino acid ABC transporter permease n=1 Tax=Thermanaerosceptrum fracticalcis TaxID=1712410 RepID=A0A7G6E2W3_THEFR|nr:branched-chain amino acid ABC transporter permease [Thermanaerosceptrum fracticalcis]QNB46417.1 branched-chain amino acid ABC transporter permease [Thermanaerosceptrum fracticalcis]